MKVRPMLAGTCENMIDVQFPVFASPKIDGVRCLIFNGKAYSRSGKLIPNPNVQEMANGLPDGLDGELVVGEPWAKGVFERTQSSIMSKSTKTDQFTHRVFDVIRDKPFSLRYFNLSNIVHYFRQVGLRQLILVPHFGFTTAHELEKYEQETVEKGFEGVMIRRPMAPYKHGRSTLREGSLLKIKRFQDDEGNVVGVEEQMRNENKKVQDSLGYWERLAKRDCLVRAGVLGALRVRWGEVEFGLGTGFDHDQRRAYWRNPCELIGKRVTFKFQGIGSDGRPRFPVFKGWRAVE